MKTDEIKLYNLPDQLKPKLKEIAKKEGRSMNRQCIHELENAVKRKEADGDGVAGDS